ncbi:hypothetical protein [Sulfitobacter sp. R18_1]|uniref:hypothetical protein n=1 Tax=Sulfitobacter sp. R18_1 TaxID=2821104 RepID=UPI001ADA15E0|nr:hypothetical protein [Sulfitobacter sp. R18_1]MBO9428483.1 hypothetical protein [Sulfitobacter sp. R18_1]
MKHTLTKRLLAGGFRVYKKRAFAINCCTAAAISFGMATSYSSNNLNYAMRMPDDPSIPSAGISPDPLPASLVSMSTPKDIQVVSKRTGATKSSGQLTPDEVEDPGFWMLDVQGVLATSLMVESAHKMGGNIVTDINYDRFNIPKYRLTEGELKAFREAAAETGKPLGLILAFASKESNFRPNDSPSTSAAKGYFQHIPSTWNASLEKFAKDYGYGWARNRMYREPTYVMSLRKNAKMSAVMAVALMKDDEMRVEGKLNRQLSEVENYVTHVLGSGNATKFLSTFDRNPRIKVNRISGLGPAIRANRNIFIKNGRYKTVQETMDWFEHEMGRRIAYFTLKYDSDNPERVAKALEFAVDKGYLNTVRHEPFRDDDEYAINDDYIAGGGSYREASVR